MSNYQRTGIPRYKHIEYRTTCWFNQIKENKKAPGA